MQLWKVSKYGVFSVFFSVRIRTKYGPEKTPYLDNFHAVTCSYRKVYNIIWVKVPLTHFKRMFYFCTPMKTSENQRFSYIFSGYRNETLAWNGFNKRQKNYFFARHFIFYFLLDIVGVVKSSTDVSQITTKTTNKQVKHAHMRIFVLRQNLLLTFLKVKNLAVTTEAFLTFSGVIERFEIC